MKTIVTNKIASHSYEILERFHAGIVLLGHEVKSVKAGHVSLKGSFVSVRDLELWLMNAHVPPYPFAGNQSGYDPNRPRKVLLRKSEIASLIGKIRSQGLTLVPLRVYTKKRLVKVEIALAKGKKSHDRRRDIAERDSSRRIDRALKTRR